MKVKIHGGDKIGGCVTEIVSRKGTRILIDIGSNLPPPEGKEKIPDEPVAEICREKEGVGGRVSGVFITHYHGDHIGQFKSLPDDIKDKTYMGTAACGIYRVIADYLTKYGDIADREKTLKDIDRINKFVLKENRKIQIPVGDDLVIEPYHVDHSAYDAYMYLVKDKTDGTRILHTGDFRSHGWTGVKDSLYRTVSSRSYINNKVDCIITEGTMLDRERKPATTEPKLKETVKEWLEKDDLFVLCSSTNIDTITSFYHAACETKKAGQSKHKCFVVDDYQKEVLGIVNDDPNPHKKKQLYCFKDDDIDLFSVNNNVAQRSKLYASMKKYGYCVLVRAKKNEKSNLLLKLMTSDKFNDGKLVYSMWDGYLAGEFEVGFMKNFVNRKPNYEIKHTGGHASFHDIERLLIQLDPCKIIPIHTTRSEALYDMKIDKKRIVENTGDYIEI